MSSKRKAEAQLINGKPVKKPKVDLPDLIYAADYVTKKDLAEGSGSLPIKVTAPLLPNGLQNISGIQFPVLDPPADGIKDLVAIVCRIYANSNNLTQQQQLYGDVIRSPLPTATDGSMALNYDDHYLLEDVDSTDEFVSFKRWVLGLVRRAVQSRRIGAVVQASGCGKSHFAKVFTRKERGIYLNFRKSSSSRKILVDSIALLRARLLPPQPTFSDYERFTSEVKSIVTLYFYCALAHYGQFLNLCATELGDIPNMEKVLVWVGSFAFNDNNIKNFHDLFESKKSLSAVDRTQYIEKVRHAVRPLEVRAIFCDELNSVASEFVGSFLHDDYPLSVVADKKLQILQYEQLGQGPYPNSGFMRPTSLLYIIISVLKDVEFVSDCASPISVVALTTSFADFNIMEITHSTRDTMKPETYTLNRHGENMIKQFGSLVRNKFGDQLGLEFEKNLEKSFAVRGFYLSIIWEETLQSLQSGSKLSFRDIVYKAKQKIRDNHASIFLHQLIAQKKHDILYAAIFHNGVRKSSQHKEVFSCVPYEKKKQLRGSVLQITDVFLIEEALTTARRYPKVQLIQTVLEGMYASSDTCDVGKKGEDLMRAIAIINKAKTFASLAVAQSSFPEDSIAHAVRVRVLYCGDLIDFDLTAKDVLEEPGKNLLARLIKPENVFKPDGLNISDEVITAWQCKYREASIGVNELEEALQSLNYNLFFQKNSANRKWWTAELKKEKVCSAWTKRYIRVVVAKKFTGEVIQLTNEWNNNNLNHPVVLVQISDHLLWEPKPSPPSPVKSKDYMYLEEEFDMFRL